MKYLLKPFLKVLWSVLLSIFATIVIIGYIIVVFLAQSSKWLAYAIWEFRFNEFESKEFSIKYSIKYDDQELASVYHDRDAAYTRRYDKYQTKTVYNTPYHYIWGIYKE